MQLGLGLHRAPGLLGPGLRSWPGCQAQPRWRAPCSVRTAAGGNGAAVPHPPGPMESLLSWLPIPVLTDSYKTTHFQQYPAADKMVAVGGTHG